MFGRMWVQILSVHAQMSLTFKLLPPAAAFPLNVAAVSPPHTTYPLSCCPHESHDDSDLTHFTWTEDPGDALMPTLPWAAISPTTPCLYCSTQPQTVDIYQ
ncbi:hypothetical protein B0H19DRAFT_75392 [Mycena capillaripes]|nr:hypothetical protein B0H19DRAFT_75392 [Mycena capillaripes]